MDQYTTILLTILQKVARITLVREEAKNSINRLMIDEIMHALRSLQGNCSVVVIEGGAEYFCFGADFSDSLAGEIAETDAIFGLLQCLCELPMVTICMVRGRVNAGGVGLVAACDIVIAETGSNFSLSEMLFGLTPACIYPFLVQRIGLAKARYMALTTTVVHASTAQEWGLVDEVVESGDLTLRRHLNRLKFLSADAIGEFKRFHEGYANQMTSRQEYVMAANRRSFQNPVVVDGILRYQATGRFPWEN